MNYLVILKKKILYFKMFYSTTVCLAQVWIYWTDMVILNYWNFKKRET